VAITGNFDLLKRYKCHGLRRGEHLVTRDDSKFGYSSIAGIVTVPLGGTTDFGAWNVHSGGGFQRLGDTATYFNGDTNNQFIGSVGLRFSY